MTFKLQSVEVTQEGSVTLHHVLEGATTGVIGLAGVVDSNRVLATLAVCVTPATEVATVVSDQPTLHPPINWVALVGLRVKVEMPDGTQRTGVVVAGSSGLHSFFVRTDDGSPLTLDHVSRAWLEPHKPRNAVEIIATSGATRIEASFEQPSLPWSALHTLESGVLHTCVTLDNNTSWDWCDVAVVLVAGFGCFALPGRYSVASGARASITLGANTVDCALENAAYLPEPASRPVPLLRCMTFTAPEVVLPGEVRVVERRQPSGTRTILGTSLCQYAKAGAKVIVPLRQNMEVVGSCGIERVRVKRPHVVHVKNRMLTVTMTVQRDKVYELSNSRTVAEVVRVVHNLTQVDGCKQVPQPPPETIDADHAVYAVHVGAGETKRLNVTECMTVHGMWRIESLLPYQILALSEAVQPGDSADFEKLFKVAQLGEHLGKLRVSQWVFSSNPATEGALQQVCDLSGQIAALTAQHQDGIEHLQLDMTFEKSEDDLPDYGYTADDYGHIVPLLWPHTPLVIGRPTSLTLASAAAPPASTSVGPFVFGAPPPTGGIKTWGTSSWPSGAPSPLFGPSATVTKPKGAPSVVRGVQPVPLGTSLLPVSEATSRPSGTFTPSKAPAPTAATTTQTSPECQAAAPANKSPAKFKAPDDDDDDDDKEGKDQAKDS
jgi:hypothetical protein